MKKGFTLIELLAIIILLGALVLIIFPNIINIVEKNQSEIDKQTLDILYSSTDEYLNNNLNLYPKTIGAEYCFSIQTLHNENYIPINVDEYLSKNIKIVIGENNSYSIVETCS